MEIIEDYIEQTSFNLSQATKNQASDLATLIDIAGEGLPSHLWEEIAAQSGDFQLSPFEVGRMRARRDEGGFSYKNAHIISRESNGVEETCGMLLGYPLTAHNTAAEINGAPEYISPLLELENQVVGTWYINALAVFREFRGMGLGKTLIEKAVELAKAEHMDELSIIVFDGNKQAEKLYLQSGFTPKYSKEFVSWPGNRSTGSWELLTKSV